MWLRNTSPEAGRVRLAHAYLLRLSPELSPDERGRVPITPPEPQAASSRGSVLLHVDPRATETQEIPKAGLWFPT